MKILKITAITLLISIILFSAFSSLVLRMPLKNPGDIWQYLASIHELKKDYPSINDPFFDSGPKDIHYGPYLVVIALISKTLNIEPIYLYLFMGFVNIIFVIACLFLFYKTLDLNRGNLSALLFVLICLLAWGSSKVSYSGYYAFPDLILNPAAPAVFAFALSLLLIVQIIKFNDDLSLNRLFLIQILSLLLFLSHILTGIMFFLITYAFCLSEIIRKMKIEKKIFFLILIPVSTILLSLLWPYFSVYNFFFDKSRYVNTSEHLAIFNVNQWISIGGAGIFGLCLLLREKNLFLYIWAAGFLSVLLSYLTPFHISLSWRFLPFLILLGFFSITRYISASINKKALYPKIILIALLIFGLGNSYKKFSYRMNWKSYTLGEWEYLNKIKERNITVLSDPYFSYIVSGLYGMNIIAPTPGHGNPLNPEESLDRSSDLDAVFNTELTSENLINLYKKYDVKYVLVDDRTPYYKWGKNIDLIKSTTNVAYQNADYTIYEPK